MCVWWGGGWGADAEALAVGERSWARVYHRIAGREGRPPAVHVGATGGDGLIEAMEKGEAGAAAARRRTALFKAREARRFGGRDGRARE